MGGSAGSALLVGVLAIHRRPLGSSRLRRDATRESPSQHVVASRVGDLPDGRVDRLRFPVALLAFAARLVHLPVSSPIVTPPDMPLVTALSLIVMASIVAGVTEEAAFRGYMQGPIERRYGLAVAILVSGTFFGLLHFPTHPADVLWMLPYYIAVSAVYGGLTWAANSILPALVLHVVGDIVVLIRWWLTGRPEWQIGSALPPLVWESGIDTQFVLTAIVSLALVVATAGAYLAVHRLRMRELAPRPSGSDRDTRYEDGSRRIGLVGANMGISRPLAVHGSSRSRLAFAA